MSAENKCRHLPICNGECNREVGQAPEEEIGEINGRTLAGGSIPMCHVEVRHFVGPDATSMSEETRLGLVTRSHTAWASPKKGEK